MASPDSGCAAEEALLFGLLDRSFAELLEVFHKLKGGLAGACASGLVAFDDLSLGVCLERGNLGVDFLYKCFHDDKNY